MNSKLNELLSTIESQFNEFGKDALRCAVDGNKSAGRRSRALSNELTKLLKQWRAESIAAEKVSKP